MNEQNTIMLIRNAWGQSEYTSEVHGSLINIKYDPEASEVSNLFVNRAWQEIPEEVVLASHPSAFLISDLAFRYYLPVFLIAALRNPGAMLLEQLLEFQLIPPKKNSPRMEFLEKFNPLSTKQCSAVTEFLYYCTAQLVSFEKTKKRVSAAIKDYWMPRGQNRPLRY